MTKFESLILQHYGTKAQFAREMGITYVTALKWIKRPGMLKLSTIEKIAMHTREDVCAILNNNDNGVHIS
jgi:hypothetical protein